MRQLMSQLVSQLLEAECMSQLLSQLLSQLECLHSMQGVAELQLWLQHGVIGLDDR